MIASSLELVTPTVMAWIEGLIRAPTMPETFGTPGRPATRVELGEGMTIEAVEGPVLWLRDGVAHRINLGG